MKKLADEIDPPAKKLPDPTPVPADPKAKLKILRDQLEPLEKAEKELNDLIQRRSEKESEISRMEADLKLKTLTAEQADSLKDKIGSRPEGGAENDRRHRPVEGKPGPPHD